MRKLSSSSVFDLVTTQHLQASAVTRRYLTVEFPPAHELARACNSIFTLVDRDDIDQQEVPRLAWRLKMTVLQTLLPFDDERLCLRQMAERLSILAEGMHAIAAPARIIDNIITALLENPKNPKLERIATELGSTNGGLSAIFAGLQRVVSPGWPLTVDSERDLGLQGVAVLRSRRDVHSQVFARIVFPGTLRFSAKPLIRDLLLGGRAREIVIAAYRGERIQIPERLELPRDTVFSSTVSSRRFPLVVTDEAQDEPLDKWVNDSSWESIRAQFPNLTPTSDRDISVNARFVLFADASGAFLPNDGTIVEISDLLDRNFEVDANRLPRKAVDSLEEHDLVLLRLSGSGDYLDEVADTLMANEGRSNLRHEATEWKSSLCAALKSHGEGVIASAFRELGGRLRSASYLWVWAGDTVIAPQSYDAFRRLTTVLAEFAPPQCPTDPDAYAKTKWDQMELVKGYQHRAGGEIRTALLERVRKLIAERQRIETVLSIALPGVESGQMGLLRVSAVDMQSVRVPYSTLFHKHSVEMK
ncbi:hypothetical protein FEQ05_04369 [Burkholderia pseudomultivorans]|uniref:Uncharacterized protein n=1 Tax=Burkholderia pseudomultivorans TaxID=1207504 RepID=A0ABU2EAB3_9BURK|nr:hypothetical protein [Burkholderia pseudomultivorans]MDR8738523.1 hypothetical protein [Burkholderia pseudomultivorans]MDR8744936.1 hypothetical protein [Burkholderia pseudomultivorans]MDR8756822.1 hypothetical protein [Burkholderia pseudomultivorans]MDR8781395.1 hypothetical protein [Burkholderia pseudomultivorans]